MTLVTGRLCVVLGRMKTLIVVNEFELLYVL